MVNIKWESVDNTIASVYHWRKFRKGFLNINTRIIVDSTADLLPKLGKQIRSVCQKTSNMPPFLV